MAPWLYKQRAGAQEAQVRLHVWRTYISCDRNATSSGVSINYCCDSGWFFEDVVHGNISGPSVH